MARVNYNNGGNMYTDASDVSFVADQYNGAQYSDIGPTMTVGQVQPEGSQVSPVTEPLSVDEPEIGGTEIIDQIQVDGKNVAQTVGWLICIKGSCKGKDFHLHNGWNYIGRDPKADVYIDDPKVSATMARVSYDSRGRGFAIAPSDQAKNLTYCGNKPLYTPKDLNAYDVISVGDTDLIFVPLCGEHFAWEE